MQINNTVSTLTLRNGQVATISARDASFTLSPPAKRRTPRSKAKRKTRRTVSAKARTRTETTKTLQAEGFTAVSDELTISNVRAAAAPSAGPLRKTRRKAKARAKRPACAEIAIPLEDEEDIVAVEFDQKTGEILDWHLPSRQSEDVNETFRPGVRSMARAGGQSSGQRSVVFEIPVSPTRSVRRSSKKRARKRSLSSGLKRVIQFFSIKNIKKVARKTAGKLLAPAVRTIERMFANEERLLLVTPGKKPRKASDKQLKRMQGKRVLLFVHGIISSTEGAFGDLIGNTQFFDAIGHKYGKNFIAYDHWTLSKTITKNASELAKRLPKNTLIDIVCHSRGAGVTRSLLENPKVTKKLKDRKIKIGGVYFVAGACEGSPLAQEDALDRVFRTVNKMSILLGQGPIAGKILTKVIKLIVAGVQELPGTDSMDPTGEEIQKLKKSRSTRAQLYCYARANFDSANAMVQKIDQVTIDEIIFQNAANDVVVPYMGASKNTNYLDGKVIKRNFFNSGTSVTPSDDVWHVNFFANPDFQDALLRELRA